MAAVTTVLSAGVALAGLGMNIAQQQKAQQNQKKAQRAAEAAANELKNVKEENPMASVQVPTLGFDLAQQGMERQTMSAIDAAKGAGAEGVIGAVPSIVQANNEANLQLGAQLGEAKYQRDVNEATLQSGINEREAIAKRQLYGDQVAGAQLAAADAATAKAEAVAGMFESGGQLVSGIGGALGPAYRYRKGIQGTPQNTTGIFRNNVVPSGTTNTNQSATPNFMYGTPITPTGF